MSTSNILRNSYPAFNLKVTFEYLQNLEQSLPRGVSVEREDLIRKLDLSPTGKANNVIGSLIHYGLLMRENRSYRLTALGLELLAQDNARHSERWRKLALQAATSPQLYSSLYAHYLERIPSDDQRGFLASKYDIDVDDAKARKIIRNYSESLDFVRGKAVDKSIANEGKASPGGNNIKFGTSKDSPLVALIFEDGTVLHLPQSVIHPALERYLSELTDLKARLLNR